MVEEKFKIGIDLEVEQDSLDAAARKIQKKFAEAAQRGTAAGTGAAGAGAAPGTTSTARSMREAIKVSSKDLGAEIQKAVVQGLSGFEAASKDVSARLERLAKALEKKTSVTAATRQPLEETQRLVSRQQGPTNQNLARDIQKSRLEAGRQTTGSGGTSEKRTDLRTGTKRDQPAAQSSAEKRAAFREMGAAGIKAQQNYAEQEAKRVAASLQKFYSALERIPEFKGRAKEIAREVGLPGPEAVGVKGGAITLKDLAGNVRIVTSDIKMFGDAVTRVNKLTANLEQLLSATGESGKTTLERAGQVARRRPKLATQMIREQIREAVGAMPIMPADKPMAPYAMGGKSRVSMRLTKDESERVSRLKDEAQRIAEVNRILEERLRLLSQEQKQALGIQRLTSVGLTEQAATKTRFITEPETKKVKEVELDVQTLDLPGMGVGGAGAMAQRRVAQTFQALALREGERPEIMGRGERAAFEAGIYEKPMARQLRTAAVGSAEFPEVSEDMILIDKSVIMDVVRTREKVMNTLAQGLKVGAQLTEGQILGTDLEGGNIVFDAKGVNAQITEIEQVIEDGIEGFRVRIEEIDPLKTGAKLTTPGGMKGIVKVADLAKEYGLPKGTEAAVSMGGMVKRGDIRDAIIMVSSEIAEKVGTSGQRVAEEIEMAMREGGMDLVEAAQKVAQSLGLEGFTGGTAVPAGGKLEKAGIQELMTGKIPFTRIGTERGMEGPAGIEEKFLPITDIKPLQMRAETAAMAKELAANMELVMSKNADLIAQLRIIAGETDVAAEGLREMVPEEFKRLPVGRAAPEEFAGTLADPERMAEAFAMKLPTRGGGEGLMRIPGMGAGLGQRGVFKTPLGAMGAEKLTGLLDRIAEVGSQIRATRGEIPMEEGTVAAQEGAEMANRQIQEMVDNIERLGIETGEGSAAAAEFLKTLMPLVDQLQGAANIQYQILGKGGKPVSTQTFKGTPGEYVRSRKDMRQQIFAVRDVLGMRADTVSKGGKFRSVPKAGAVYQDVEMLQKVMQTLNIAFDESSDHVQKLYDRLEKFQAQLEETYTALAIGRTRGQGAPAHKRRLAQQVGGGVADMAFMKAIQMPAGVGKELEEVRTRLIALKEGGANVSAALEALERTAALQPEAGGVERDIVVMSKEDYEKHIERMIRKGMSPEEAEASMKKPALVHRYPTTGGASYMQARILKDITGRVPAGKVGVPGPFPISSKEDFQQMMGPLEAEQQRLRGVLKETRGLGAAADEARQELGPLNSVIESLRRSFRALTLNLDFDGDQVQILTQQMGDLGDQTTTAVQDLKSGALSVREVFANIFGETMGVPTGGLEQFGGLFEAGMGKLRGPELRKAVLMPETAETTAKEAEALVGGKTSVGLLSDAFNKLSLSIIGGADQMDDAFATGMERIMLFINESLGGAGAAGPMQFIEDLRKGNLESIFGKMEAGKGVYGDLGNVQKVMRERVEMFMAGMDPDQLMQMAREAGKEVGDPEEAIQVLVEEMDLKNTIKMMFEALKNNMRDALQISGLDPKEIEAEIKAMLGPKGKGLDLDTIIKNLFPAFAMTRRQVSQQMEGLAPATKAQKALEALPQQAAEQATKLYATTTPDTKVLAQGLIKTLGNWYRQYRKTFEVVSAEQIAQQTGLGLEQARRVGGQFQPETGRTFVGREAAFEPFIKALRTLAEVARGEGPRTQEEFVQLARTLAELPRIISHEAVHQANKEYSDSVDELVKRLRTGTGALGESAEEVWASLTRAEGGLINVRQEVEKLGQMQVGLEAGEVTPEAFARQKEKTYRVAAEEMLAESADPARMKRLLPDLSEAGMAELMELFEAVKEHAPEMIAAGTEARDHIARTLGTIFNMLTDALQEPGGAGAARAAAEARIADRTQMDFPGRADFMRRKERMTAAQAGLTAGRRAWGIPEEIEVPKGAEAIGGLGDAFRRLFKSAESAVEQMDPDALRRAEKELNEVGREYQTRLKELQTGPGARPEMAGIQGFNEYMRAMVQFRMKASQAYLKQMKQLEAGIQTARQLGQEEVAQEMADKLAEMQDEFEGLLAVWRRPVGRRMAHPMMGQKGEPTAGFQELGIAAPPQVYEDIMRSIGGTGAEAEAFKPIASALMQVQQLIEEGADSTVGWMRMWEALEASPKNLKDNLYKVVEAAGAFGKTMGGAGSSARTNMEEIAKLARSLTNVLAKNPFEGTEEGLERLMQMFPQFAKVVRMGRGRGLAASIEEQYENAIAVAKARAKELTEVIGTEAYKKLEAAGKHFEPMKFDIKDESGAVIQRMQANFEKGGGRIKAVMKAAGANVGRFGDQMRSALRRVVQWGFASGIIYGTIRALRNMVQVTVEVQTKMMQLQKVMDTSITDFVAMQDSAVSMAKAFGISISEVLDGMVVYGQQGLKMAEITERTRATLLAVNVTTLDAAGATEALTAAHKVFGNEVDNSISFVDAWGAVAAKHAITAKDLADAVKRSGAAAQVAGVGFNDYLGIVTAIGAVSRQTGKEIATGTKFMFRAMRRPTAQKELLKQGIPSATAAGELRPAMDILGQLATRWQDMSRAQQLSTAQAMAGIRHYNQFIILMKNFDEALAASADAANSQGFAIRKNALAMETLAKQMQVLRETAKGVVLEVGKVMLPAVTSMVKGLQGLLDIVGKLPGPIQQFGIIGLASMVGIHKGADVVLDSFDAIFGYQTQLVTKQKGLVAGLAGMVGGGAKKLFGGMGAAMNAGAAGMVITDTLGRDIKGADKAKDIGLITRAIMKAKSAAGIAAASFSKMGLALKAATAATVVGAIVAVAAGLAYLTIEMMNVAKAGKDVEDSLFDAIGQSQDAAKAYGSQVTSLQRVEQAYKKVQKAIEITADPKKFQAALDAGTFKGAVTAAKEYHDIIGNVSMALAELDPMNIKGMTDTGDYIVGITAEFQNMALSAADAQSAITASMQVKVIKAYADQLTKVTSKWDRFLELVTGKGRDPSSRLKDARDAVKKLSKEINDMGNRGLPALAHQQEALNTAAEKELKIRKEVVGMAMELKRVMEEMPKFESPEMAKMVLETPDLQKAIETALPTGVFGRQATMGSVMMRQMSRNMGLGGMVGYETAGNAGLTIEKMLEKGIRQVATNQVTATRPGGVATIERAAAEELLSKYEKLSTLAPEALDAAIESAQVGFTMLDKETGEIMYRFWDNIGRQFVDLAGNEINQILNETGTAIVTADRSEIERAAEQTKKLLTLQATGALAGIRIPGDVELGPARLRDLTAQQRMFADIRMEEPLQRLVDLQKEMTTVQNQYNEAITEGNYEEAGKVMTQNAQDLKVLDTAMQEMVMALQLEQFDLTAIAHFNQAMQEMEVVLDNTRDAVRDLAVEEEARFSMQKHTTGALAGLPVMPQLELGKTLRELAPRERLQRRLPEFAKLVSQFSIIQKQMGQLVTARQDIRKRQERVLDMIAGFEKARTKLTGEQVQRRQEMASRGIDEGVQEMADTFVQQSDLIRSAIVEQTPILDKMLVALEEGIQLAGMSEEERRGRAKELIGQKAGRDIAKAIGSVSASALTKQVDAILGMRELKPEEKPWWDKGPLGERFFKGESRVEFGKKETEEVFDTIADRIKGLREIAADLEIGKLLTGPTAMKAIGAIAPLPGKPGMVAGQAIAGKGLDELTDYIGGQLEEAYNELYSIPEVADTLRKVALQISKRKKAAETQLIAEKKNAQGEERLAQWKAEATRALDKAMQSGQNIVSTYMELAKVMGGAENIRLVEAAEGLYKSLEDLVVDFKKTEALAYRKIGSVLEGPFARVGKPGFRTDFEERRRAEEEKGIRPMSMQDYQAREKELAKIEYDEKEARIKQTQDAEVEALRQQQQQAERVRQTMADALFSGQLAGTGLEQMAKNYMNTLTDELARSEQATMGPRGELMFAGVPALDDVKRIMAQIRERQKDLISEEQIKNHKKALEPLLNETQRQSGALNSVALSSQQIAENTAKLAGQAGAPGVPGAAGAPAVLGVPAGRAGGPGTVAGPTRDPFARPGMDRTAAPALSMQEFADMLLQSYRGAPGVERLSRDLGQQISKTIYTGDIAKRPGMFVREQTFRPGGAEERGLTAADLARGIRDAITSGARVIRPTGALGGATQFTDRPELQGQGATNWNLMQEIQAKHKFGGDFTGADTVTNRETGNAPGVPADDRRAPGGAAEAQAEASQTLADAVASLQDTLASLTERGLQVDNSSVVTAVETTGGLIVDAIGTGSEVTITNDPLSVVVANIGDIGTTAVAGVGAQVDALASLIQSVEANVPVQISEAVLEVQSELENQIAAVEVPDEVTSLVDRVGTLETATQDISTLAANVDTAATEVGSINRRITDLEAGTVNLETAVSTIDGQVAIVETRIVQLEGEFVRLNDLAQSANSQAQTALNIANTAKRN